VTGGLEPTSNLLIAIRNAYVGARSEGPAWPGRSPVWQTPVRGKGLPSPVIHTMGIWRNLYDLADIRALFASPTAVAWPQQGL